MTDKHVLRLAELPKGQTRSFELIPDEATRASLVQDLGLIGLRKLSFRGTLSPRGKQDWALEARLGATVIQECGVTLAPVTTRIDQDVRRHFKANFETPLGDDVEMPQDVSQEALPEILDLHELLHEELSLALPLFPRADGAELDETVFTEDGVAPLKDEDLKPFAGLASLKAKLETPKGDA